MYGWGVPAGELATGALIQTEPHLVRGQWHGHRQAVTVDRRERVGAGLVMVYAHPSRECLGSSPTERVFMVYETRDPVLQIGWETA
jgi:hypothetical protein